MESSVLKVNNLSKSFRVKYFRKVQALNGLSMSLKRGEIYGFVGENGSGKTTLMRIVAGRIFADDGNIELFGKSQKADYTAQLAKIGALIEQPGIYGGMTVWDNLWAVSILKSAEDRKHIEKILNTVGLTAEKNMKAKNLSLGKKQRLGIGMALIGNPELLILDEPINGMDPRSMIEFRETMQLLNQENGVTILISSHILSELDKLATCYGFIKEGRLVEEISAEELHRRCQSCITIKTGDSKIAANLLEQLFPGSFVTRVTKQTLLMFGFEGNIEDIQTIFRETNMSVEEVTIKEGSLESYYLYKMEDYEYNRSKKDFGMEG